MSELSEIARARIDALTAENAQLRAELESHAWEVSPAMAQARIDQLHARAERYGRALREIAEMPDLFAAEVARAAIDASMGGE